VRGRIGALIEVAAGFHPDLTGRENIFLQGAIMGMRRAEVERKKETIIEFAGVADFIDTPVKRYSSGMNARLGFAIAAHLEPDVLIIDEVLSVGDAAFQERCLQRMQAIRDAGTTLIFVSHDLQAVGNLCDQAVYLNHEVRAIGTTSDVIGTYLRDAKSQAVANTASPVKIERARLLDAEGAETAEVASTARMRLQVDVSVAEPIADLTLGLILYRSTDHLILHEANVVATEIGFDSGRTGTHTVDFTFAANVTRGHYHLECYVLHTPTHEFIARLCPAAMFTVHDVGACRGIAAIKLMASTDELVGHK
jgi:lipopolysaccharide transport system ATP-binding protein